MQRIYQNSTQKQVKMRQKRAIFRQKSTCFWAVFQPGNAVSRLEIRHRTVDYSLRSARHDLAVIYGNHGTYCWPVVARNGVYLIHISPWRVIIRGPLFGPPPPLSILTAQKNDRGPGLSDFVLEIYACPSIPDIGIEMLL